MTRLGLAVISLTVLVFRAGHAAAGQPPSPSDAHADALLMRVRPDASLDTLRYIATLEEPKRRTVDATASLSDLLKAEYGSSHDKIRKIFLDYNPDYASLAGKGGKVDVTLPVLPVWDFDVVLSPSPNTIKRQVAIHTGESGPKTQAETAKRNPEAARKGWANPATQPLKLRYTTGFFTVRLKQELKDNPGEILARLHTLDQNGSIQAAVPTSSNVDCIPHWQPANAPVRAPVSTVDPKPESTWAFESLPKNLDLKESVTIAVVDSGIATDTTGGPDKRFETWTGKTVVAGPPKAGVVSCGDRSTVGCNFLARATFPKDDLVDPRRQSHGTHVAGLASARPLTAFRSELDRWLSVMALKVVDSNARVDSGMVLQAISFADAKNAEIVNISLSGTRNEEIERQMLQAKRFFVLAAGNSDSGQGANLDDDQVDVGYPARIAPQLPNAISVAAHDSLGRLASFSNYGPSSVEIAAPGVDVLSTAIDGQYLSLSGTSQAAPLVAFTAALLRAASPLFKDPTSIKQRLMASVDVTADLRDVVVSHGKLNMSKALAFGQDAVQLNDKDRTLTIGKIVSPSGISMAGRNRVTWDQVLKVTLNYSNVPGARHLIMVRSGNPSGYEYWVGDVNLDTFDELILEGRPDSIKSSTISDILPRFK